MEFSELENNYQGFYAPGFEIKVDKREILVEGAEVISVSVDNTLDGADHFSFTINNPYDVDKRELKWLESDLFDVGNEVEINLGYVSRLKTMILGEISSIRPTFPSSGVPQIEVSGYDLSHRMTKSKKSNSWDDTTDSDVVKEIASKYKLKTTGVEDTGVKHNKIIQDKETDFDLIKKRAKDNGFEFFVIEETLYFRAPKDDRTEFTTLEWGKTLNSFSPELNVANQVSEVEVRHWDPKTKKEIVGKAKKGDEHGRDQGKQSGGDIVEDTSGGAVVEIIRRPVYSKEEADTLAKAALNKLAEGLIKGRGECIGIPEIIAGENIRLEGLGKKFTKTYYIEKTTHNIGGSGYKTTFNVKEKTI